MNKNRAKRKADRAAAYEVICEGLCIAAGFPLTVGFIWLSDSLERALMHFGAAVILGLSAAAFHRAADALYTEEVVSNVVSAELIRAVGASLRSAGKKKSSTRRGGRAPHEKKLNRHYCTTCGRICKGGTENE